jgi:biofilm PGA synthesis N-glycosyltransferase PgaC
VGTLGSLWAPAVPRPHSGGLGIEILIDGFCLDNIAHFYGQRRRMWWYPTTAIIYPFFLVAVGTAALMGIRADWKGRR